MVQKLLLIVAILLQYSLITAADCDHDSRYPHTGNCEHYYQCYYGTLYELSCPDGLHFDADSGACDSPENANCKIEEKCVDEDLLPHADSCELFYKCSGGNLEVLSCPNGLHFNPIGKQCDWPEEAKCAVTEEKCVDGDLLPHSENCQLFFKCSGGSLEVLSCPDGLHFNLIEGQCDWPADAKCQIMEDNCVDGELFPHEGSCELFYQCSGASLQLQTCPQGLHFNPIAEYCDWPNEAKCEIAVDKCFDGELFAHDDSCGLFYQCSGGSLHLQSCPDGLHFNSNEKSCDFPEQAQCAIVEEKCVDGDLFPHSDVCELFYLCAQGNLQVISCPEGLRFDSTEKRCDYPENVVCASK